MTRCQTPVPFAEKKDHESPYYMYLPTSAHQLTPFASPVTEKSCVDLDALISSCPFYRPTFTTFTTYSPLDGEVTPPLTPKPIVQVPTPIQLVSPNARRTATPLTLPLPLVVADANSASNNKRKFTATTEDDFVFNNTLEHKHQLPATPLVAGNKKHKTVGTAQGSPTTTTSLESLIQSSLRHAKNNRVSNNMNIVVGSTSALHTNNNTSTEDELPAVGFPRRGIVKPVARRVSRSFLSADELWLVPGDAMMLSSTADNNNDEEEEEDLDDFPVVPTRLFVPDLKPLLENRTNSHGLKS